MIDSELVRRARNGDDDAFNAIVHRYANAIYGVAYGKMRNYHLAQDIAQEVLIKAYLKLDKLKEPDKIGSWLYSITSNTCQNWFRRTRNCIALDESMATSGIDETGLNVRQALDSLSEPSRLAVILHYIDGYSTKEIASFLALTPKAIENKLRRARASLRRELIEMVEENLSEHRLGTEFEGRIKELVENGLRIIKETNTELEAGKTEGHAGKLARAASLLSDAYRSGAKNPEVVWALKDLYFNTGHLEENLVLLKDYMENTEDPVEKFKAGHFTAVTTAILAQNGLPGGYETTVEFYKRLIGELRQMVPGHKILGSLAYGEIAHSFRETGRIDEWLDLSQSLYNPVEPLSIEALPAVIHYLLTLIYTYNLLNSADKAIDTAEHLYRILECDDTPEGLFRVSDVIGQLIFLYRKAGDTEKSDKTEQKAHELIDKVELLAKSEPARYTWTAYGVGHDLGFVYMENKAYEEAIPFFERALNLRDDSLTRFFYAGVLWKARGNRGLVLESIRKAASDPRSSLIHRLEREFKTCNLFTGLEDDEEFLSVIREAENRYSTIC